MQVASITTAKFIIRLINQNKLQAATPRDQPRDKEDKCWIFPQHAKMSTHPDLLNKMCTCCLMNSLMDC